MGAKRDACTATERDVRPWERLAYFAACNVQKFAARIFDGFEVDRGEQPRPLQFQKFGGQCDSPNRGFGGFMGRATAAQNLPSDRVGAINRAYAGIHHLKQFAKRAKQANRTLYKLVQVTLILGVLYLLIFG